MISSTSSKKGATLVHAPRSTETFDDRLLTSMAMMEEGESLFQHAVGTVIYENIITIIISPRNYYCYHVFVDRCSNDMLGVTLLHHCHRV
jgi:hypothetical protein